MSDMPPLPEPRTTGPLGNALFDMFDMHSYARAYAEQERAFWVKEADKATERAEAAEQETAALQKQLGECSGGYQTLEREVTALKNETAALRADAERWRERAVKAGWKPPDETTIWYMRDNHTFVRIPLNFDDAMERLRLTFHDECGHYGMLAVKGSIAKPSLHARADWNEFAAMAAPWLRELFAAIDAAREPKP